MNIMIIGSSPVEADEEEFSEYVSRLGQILSAEDHDFIICSPFERSADLAFFNGVIAGGEGSQIEIHYPNSEVVSSKVDLLDAIISSKQSSLRRFPYQPPDVETDEAQVHSWLYSQIRAMERASIILAVGGRVGASAQLMLGLARDKNKPIIPLNMFGGASKAHYERYKYEFDDIITDQIGLDEVQFDPNKLPEYLMGLVTSFSRKRQPGLKVFLSYSREDENDADFVEMTLRRRGITVFRDESELEPGHMVPDQIREGIAGSNLFLALWSVNYCSSPWCFDEIQFALDLKVENKIDLWILRLDETRIVPPRARNALYFDTTSRVDLSDRLQKLLSGAGK